MVCQVWVLKGLQGFESLLGFFGLQSLRVSGLGCLGLEAFRGFRATWFRVMGHSEV